MQPALWRRIKKEIVVWRVGVIPGIAVFGLITIARLTGSLQSLEWIALDHFLRLRPEEPVDERIVIVGINEADIRSIGNYPIPDQALAVLLKKLQTYQPRVIGLDIFRDLPVEPGHAKLVATFQDSKNLIAIEKVLPVQVAPPPKLPLEQIGFVDALIDLDGNLRRSLLATPTPEGYKLSLSLQLATAYLLNEGITLENGLQDPEAMRFGLTELPRFSTNSGGYVRTDAGGVQVLLNFRSGTARFRNISFQDIKTGKVNSTWLRDRIVIVGVTAPSVKDTINTSVITGINPVPELVYGVEIQAHAVSQIINAVLEERPLLRSWADGWDYLWILGWSLLGISIGRLSESFSRHFFSVGIATISLFGLGYLLLTLGWWIPVVPAMLVLILNGVGLAAFYQYDRALKERINDRQLIIERTFDTIHNGPLQTLARLLRHVREQDLPHSQLVEKLEHLNHELRAVYESVQREALTQGDSVCLAGGTELELQDPMHEILYEVYRHTLERDFPCFKTLKVKVRTFEPIDERCLSIEQKRGLCRFLEEALCNVGKHAQGVTRLCVTCSQQEGWYTLRITDNGVGNCSNLEGRGTQQCRNLARQMRGKFQRSPLSPQGTLCELTWPTTKFKFW